jgi:hypothetical protein
MLLLLYTLVQYFGVDSLSNGRVVEREIEYVLFLDSNIVLTNTLELLPALQPRGENEDKQLAIKRHHQQSQAIKPFMV